MSLNNVDYTAVEIFPERPYSDLPYLVIPEEVFRINLSSESNRAVRAFVYRKSELFGDPVPLNLAGLSISFSLYNSENVLVLVGKGVVSDINTSEIEYVIEQFDIQNKGRYYGHFILTDVDGKSLMLPNPKQKQRITLIAN